MPKPNPRDAAGEKLTVRPATGPDRPVRRDFPGPRGATATLRVAVERTAYADLIAHAKASLDAEVCGVLAGQVGEDEAGRFVLVEAVVRGNAATQGATHVTFTQATWNAIHETMERDHPRRHIVGWYHTHPGFGVEFSDMDLFIQRNFFPGPTQLALVTDPMSGAVAIAVNTDRGIEYLPRYWVDGREQTGQVPVREAPAAAATAGGTAGGGSVAAADFAQSVKTLEARVGQLIQANDEQRASFHQLSMTVGLVLCLCAIAAAGYFIYNQYTAPLTPPQFNNYVPVPVQLGNKTVLLGVGIVTWDVPPALNSLLLQMEQLKQAAAEKAAADKAAANKAGGKNPDASPPADGGAPPPTALPNSPPNPPTAPPAPAHE